MSQNNEQNLEKYHPSSFEIMIYSTKPSQSRMFLKKKTKLPTTRAKLQLQSSCVDNKLFICPYIHHGSISVNSLYAGRELFTTSVALMQD